MSVDSMRLIKFQRFSASVAAKQLRLPQGLKYFSVNLVAFSINNGIAVPHRRVIHLSKHNHYLKGKFLRMLLF